MSEQQLYFNGLDGATGDYAVPPMTLTELFTRLGSPGAACAGDRPRGVAAGVDPDDLASAGWAVIFAKATPVSVREALRPLLDHRRAQAAGCDERLYREIECPPGQSARAFLDDQGVGPGPVRPKILPYYLLLVGSPEEISFEVQEQLDLQHAVARLHLETAEEYASYARTVVETERSGGVCTRRAVLFAPQSEDDEATRMSVNDLTLPLAAELGTVDPYQLELITGEAATKEQLLDLLSAPAPPALVLTAGHGICYGLSDPRQRERQGGLVCADWPGPRRWHRALPDSFLLLAEDLPDRDRSGLITFHFACYSGGTPRIDSFTGEQIARRSFVARLPQRLLGNARGGALATIAHVDRSWQHSFLWSKTVSQPQLFQTALWHLLHGTRVGHAMACFGERYAELAAWLYDRQLDRKTGPEDEMLLGGLLWTAYWDARRYTILGDPAVRLDAPLQATKGPSS